MAGQITVPILVAHSTGTLDEDALHAPTDLPLIDDAEDERADESRKDKEPVSA